MLYRCRCFKYIVNARIQISIGTNKMIKEEQISVQVGSYTESRRYMNRRKRKMSKNIRTIHLKDFNPIKFSLEQNILVVSTQAFILY